MEGQSTTKSKPTWETEPFDPVKWLDENGIKFVNSSSFNPYEIVPKTHTCSKNTKLL